MEIFTTSKIFSMKLSRTLSAVSVILGAARGTQALWAQYCQIGPPACATIDPVPIRECVTLDHLGTVSYFEASVSCVLYTGTDCTGDSTAPIRGQPNTPNFSAASFLCFPP
ncbi:hypothetical protein BDZ94DRAFT_1253921 [Collybia nuda]|uniref:Uncharacterized protein n=1 Tax=Collybia nuda TaxID=64659 RepID=A0A9P5YA41_9AGAR|nr:hypothetical protein BDZ94DRAFT_1253921 [Collybia nuda]